MIVYRLTPSSCARFGIVYLSSEGKPYSYACTEKYTRLIPCGGSQAGDVCVVSQTQNQLNCRAVAPRKLEVRAVAAIRAEILRTSSAEILPRIDDPRIETQTAETELFSPHGAADGTFTFRQPVRLPVPREQLTALFRADAVLNNEEIRVIRNKVMLNGVCVLTLTAADAQGVVYPGVQFRLTYSETLDVIGAEEEDECFICLRTEDVRADLKAGAGEDDALEVQITAAFALLTGRHGKQTYLKDAFAPGYALEIAAEDILLDRGVVQTEFTFPFEAQAECFDAGADEICDAYLTDLCFTAVQEGGEVQLSGSATVNALLKNRDGALWSVSRSASFSCGRETADVCTRRRYAAYCRSVSASFERSGLLRFTGEICVRGFEIAALKTGMLISAALPENAQRTGEEQIVVYYAEKNEHVWDIAKENGSTVAGIRESNGLQSDVLAAPAVLVFLGR